MKRASLGLVLMAVLTVLSAELRAQSAGPKSASSDRTDEIIALEKAFDEAIVRWDVAALDKMTSEDFTLIGLNGNLLGKGEVLKYFATRAFEYEYRESDNVKIRVYGDAAVVTGRTLETVQKNGQDQSDAFRFTRVYIRQKGQWLLVALQPTRFAEQ